LTRSIGAATRRRAQKARTKADQSALKLRVRFASQRDYQTCWTS